MKLITFILFLACFAQAEIQRLQEVEQNSIYRGSQPQTAEDYRKLKSLGIKTIINLRWDKSVAQSQLEARTQRIKFFNFPIKASDYPDSAQINKIFEVLSDPRNQPIFIHCQHGKDRTGLIAALYRVHYQNWKPHEARKEWLEMGFAIRFLKNLDQFFSDSVN